MSPWTRTKFVKQCYADLRRRSWHKAWRTFAWSRRVDAPRSEW